MVNNMFLDIIFFNFLNFYAILIHFYNFITYKKSLLVNIYDNLV